MEGSSLAKARELIRRDAAECLRRGGLPAKAAAWVKAKPRVTSSFKRDATAGTKFWRGDAYLIARLPKKPPRTADQQYAADLTLPDCRRSREDFLSRHAE